MTTASHSQHRVLVVDDNVDGADMLATLLHLDGIDAKAVYNGQSALAVMREWRLTAALVDLSMPNMDGFSVAQAARKIPGCSAITLIALTGWRPDEVAARCAAAGFNGVLVKPLELEQLYRLLD